MQKQDSINLPNVLKEISITLQQGQKRDMVYNRLITIALKKHWEAQENDQWDEILDCLHDTGSIMKEINESLKSIASICQEQIELSGFLAHELSAFLFFDKAHWEQEMSGGRTLVSPLWRSYP